MQWYMQWCIPSYESIANRGTAPSSVVKWALCDSTVPFMHDIDYDAGIAYCQVPVDADVSGSYSFGVDLLSGAVMGVIATPAKMPFFVVKTRLQEQAKGSNKYVSAGCVAWSPMAAPVGTKCVL